MIVRAIVMTIGLASLATCLLVQGGDERQSGGNRASFIGTWELVSTEQRLTDGSKRPYLDVGAQGKGYLIYTADGHMCAAGMNSHRPAWQVADNPTDTEKMRAMDGFFGYCCRYEFFARHLVIYLYPVVGLDPYFVGTKQIRPFRLDGETLTFSDKDTTPGVESYVIQLAEDCFRAQSDFSTGRSDSVDYPVRAQRGGGRPRRSRFFLPEESSG